MVKSSRTGCSVHFERRWIQSSVVFPISRTWKRDQMSLELKAFSLVDSGTTNSLSSLCLQLARSETSVMNTWLKQLGESHVCLVRVHLLYSLIHQLYSGFTDLTIYTSIWISDSCFLCKKMSPTHGPLHLTRGLATTSRHWSMHTHGQVQLTHVSWGQRFIG